MCISKRKIVLKLPDSPVIITSIQTDFYILNKSIYYSSSKYTCEEILLKLDTASNHFYTVKTRNFKVPNYFYKGEKA